MRKIIFVVLICSSLIFGFYLLSSYPIISTTLKIDNLLTEPVNNISSEIENKYVSPISIDYLRTLQIDAEKLKIEYLVSENNSYQSFLASYISEGDRIFAQLTIPNSPKPDKGYPVIIFNHGYIPPKSYNTFANYSAYVDYLARNGFVVLKIDMRGHGKSEGQASGTYFSSTYLKDVLSAKSAISKLENIDSSNIGLWGHSMSGNLVLRTMLVDNTFKAGVIWGGAVYSYEDFYKYRISDSSYSQSMQPQVQAPNPNRESSEEIVKFRSREIEPNFKNDFWKSISLTANIKYLEKPIQIHHSINDNVVNVGYSRDLVEVLKNNNKNFEYFEYVGGGHNITGVYFNQAMQRTVEFFKKELK